MRRSRMKQDREERRQERRKCRRCGAKMALDHDGYLCRPCERALMDEDIRRMKD